MSHVIDYEFGISAIDSGYQRPLLDAIHLVVEGGRAAVIDTGVNSSVPLVLEALRSKGLRPEQVDYVILTHIHLDHAGGAGGGPPPPPPPRRARPPPRAARAAGPPP